MVSLLIDVSRLVYRQLTRTQPTGIDRVSIEYIRHYGAHARAVLCLGPFSAVLSAADSARAFEAMTRPVLGGRWLACRLIAKAVAWRWLRLPARRCVLLNTSHSGLENHHYAWALRRAGARLVVMVHDLIPISHPEYFPAGALAAHQRRMLCAARLGAGIVANSRATLEALMAFCRAQAVGVPPSVVALLAPGLAAQAGAQPPPAAPLSGPYFVILGTIEPRKNHWMLLQVWRRLCETMGPSAPKLVVVGKRGWECENVVDLLERCSTLHGTVLEAGRLSDEALLPYLRHARALLFPSFVEGYGMPVTEALALGVPVIASDIDVFHEIAGAVPDFASPLDGVRWEALVRDYARPDSALRAAQMERLTRYVPPTWKSHFEIVDGLLDQVQAGA